MNGLPYYKAYPRDFIEGTIGMSFELKAAYRIVLDLIYMQGGNLPDDAKYISGNLNVSVRKWNNLRQELLSLGKLEVSGDFLTNYRAVIELESLRKLQDNQSINASKPRKNNGLGVAVAKPARVNTEPEPDIIPLAQGREAREQMPFDAFDQFWELYPHKTRQGAARQQFDFALIKSGSLQTILDGVRRYASKQDDRAWMSAVNWLADECWTDEPAQAPQPRSQQKINPRMEANRRFLERHMNNEQPSNTGASVLKLVNGSTEYD